MAKRTLRPIEERFWEKVDKNGPIPVFRPELGPCWLWTASGDSHGYGQFRLDGRLVPAHGVAYQLIVGPVPDGLELDHLCRVHRCIRPSHLEAVTHLENHQRGARAMLTHCPQGHPYDAENTYRRPDGKRRGSRECRRCRKERKQRFDEQQGIFA